MTGDGIRRLERTEIDGVPVFWAPVEGPRVVSLAFRVGRADEPAHLGGITHLVEHLTLAPLTQQDYGHNGFVAPLRTVFHATGTDAQLVDFIGSVTATLADLPLDRILLERRILGQEASGRSHGSPGTQRWFRYGYRGQGLVGAEELGLGWLGPEPVAAWSRSWFTRENAALWWSAEPPATLRIPLPDGTRHAVPRPETVPGVAFPTRTDLGGEGLSIGFLGERRAATTMLQEILTRRLRLDLRFERGLIYDVGSEYEPIAADEAHLTVGMDCPRADAAEAAATVLRTLSDLRDRGATPEEIEREATAFAERSAQPGALMGFLDGAAHDALLGRAREEPAAIVAEYRAVDTDQVRAAADRALGSLLLFAPPGPYDEGVVTLYPGYSPRSVTGRTIRPSGWWVGPKARRDRLIVGADGVTWVTPDGRFNTVRYDECVAIRHWDGPVRELWGADGFRVVVDAAAWRDGAAIVAEIDAAVPPEVIACDEHGIGALEAPPQAGTAGVG